MSGGKAQVAACLVVHEDLSGLDALAQSLCRQTTPVEPVVVCVNTPDCRVVERVRERLPGAVIVERPDNPGFAGGINACLRETGDAAWALFLNPDVVLDVDYVTHCLERFRCEDRAGAVGGLLLRRTRDGRPCVDSAGFHCQPWLRLVDRGSGVEDLDRFDHAEDVVGVCAAAALFSIPALHAVAEDGQVMDEDFWMYKEDQDLCLRLRRAGFRILFEPRARAEHARGWAPHSRSGVAPNLRRHSLKNRYLLLMKHWSWRRNGATLPLLLLFELAVFCGLLLRDPRAMAGYLWAWRGRHRARHRRKRLNLRFPEPPPQWPCEGGRSPSAKDRAG